MNNREYYLSLPHDMSGSMSKNRFRMELLWGISKMLDVYDTSDFTMVFDYACDIELHLADGFEFYQIKTHSGNKSYTWKKLTTVKGEGSILGKLYILNQDSPNMKLKLAVVSNSPITVRTKFGLNEIEPDSFKTITKNFTASGSNKPIATVVWYLTMIKMRKQFNSTAIDFPVVFDSPNNAETDDMKRHNLIQYILDEVGKEGQLILSSIGFEVNKFSSEQTINVISLENGKYHLLDEDSYEKYYSLLSELCDAE